MAEAMRHRRLALAACAGLLLGAAGLALPARAELRLCNTTTSRVGVSLGYRDAQGWVTEGWWNLAPKGCATVVSGPLSARFYYIHALDYDRGGEWPGKAFMCTRDREFSIRGIQDCYGRGYDRSAFYEVDTGEQTSWTVQITDPRQ